MVDIDGTLTCPSSCGKYIEHKPNDKVVKSLMEHHKNRYYIILHTARNMRSFNGNIGLINKHTLTDVTLWLKKHSIPYDEIHIGKPWGPNVAYIDDKSISIEDFIHE